MAGNPRLFKGQSHARKALTNASEADKLMVTNEFGWHAVNDNDIINSQNISLG